MSGFGSVSELGFELFAGDSDLLDTRGIVKDHGE